jgi:Flp pilus assembly protein TadD
MPTLSVVMIVKDEAACLSDCLSSIRAIADEIVVADTGSTDGTVEIARRLGARVIEIPWRDDFAEARNQVLALATGDWLLHLDADEMVDTTAAERIREIVDADGFGADAIEVTLANYCDESRAWRWVPADPADPMARGASGYLAVGLLRLFRNGLGFEYREPVHENITESVVERGGVIRREPILIHHYGYAETDESKAALYLDLARKKAAARPGEAKAWHDLAEQQLACGDATAAERSCRKALVVEPRHVGAATCLGNLLLNRGHLDDARALLEDLESVGISPPHVVTALGAIACRQGRFDEARRRLEAVVSMVPSAFLAHLHLARVLDLLGCADEARERLRQAADAAPGLDEARQRLEAHGLRQEAELLVQRGDPQRALPILVDALRIDSEDPVTQNDLGVVLTALGDRTRARQCLERALRLAPGMPEAEANLRAVEESGP